jgi:hypothetical protein
VIGRVAGHAEFPRLETLNPARQRATAAVAPNLLNQHIDKDYRANSADETQGGVFHGEKLSSGCFITTYAEYRLILF